MDFTKTWERLKEYEYRKDVDMETLSNDEYLDCQDEDDDLSLESWFADLESLFADDDKVETEEFDDEDNSQDEDDDLLPALFRENVNKNPKQKVSRLKKVEDEEKAYYDQKIAGLKRVSDVFVISEERVKSLIPVSSYILTCGEEELVDKYNFYKELFGDSLLTLINVDHTVKHLHYSGFFSYKDKLLVVKKIAAIEKLFNFSTDEVISLLKNTTFYLYYSEKRFKEYVSFIMDFLSINIDEAAILFKEKPNIIEISETALRARFEKVRVYLGCSEEDLKKAYRDYPLFIGMKSWEIDYILRFKINRTDDVKKAILRTPWVLDCISSTDSQEYCGFECLQDLLALAEDLTNYFGKIVRVYRDVWEINQCHYQIRYLLAKRNEGGYYLVCLGGTDPVQLLLKATLGKIVKYNNITYQIVPETDLQNLDTYFYYARIRFGVGFRRALINGKGECLIEISLREIDDQQFQNIFRKFSPNEIFDIRHTVILDKEHSLLYGKYLEEIKQNDSESACKDLLSRIRVPWKSFEYFVKKVFGSKKALIDCLEGLKK